MDFVHGRTSIVACNVCRSPTERDFCNTGVDQMTRRDARLIEALIGESRVWIDTFGPGTIWVAAQSATNTSGAIGEGGRSKSANNSSRIRPRQTSIDQAGNSKAARPGLGRGT
jgi:hypothetical protein